MQISEIFDSATGFVALGALVAIALLLPLYLSQRRDVQRMRTWMDREPGHPAADIAASEAILDHAERELEELLGPEEAAAEPAPGRGRRPRRCRRPPASRMNDRRSSGSRWSAPRSRRTPRWRRFVADDSPCAHRDRRRRALLGGAICLRGASRRRRGRGAACRAIDRADVTVAVLNGTSVNRLAGNVGSDVEASGYVLGPVSSTTPGVEKTAVLYADGPKRAAQKVARDLGVDKATVEPVDRETRRLAGDADVVVIAGEDRTS